MLFGFGVNELKHFANIVMDRLDGPVRERVDNFRRQGIDMFQKSKFDYPLNLSLKKPGGFPSIIPESKVTKRTKPEHKRVLAFPRAPRPYGETRNYPTFPEPRIVSGKVSLGIARLRKCVEVVLADTRGMNHRASLWERLAQGIIDVSMDNMTMRSDINLEGDRGFTIHNGIKMLDTRRITKLGDIISNGIPAGAAVGLTFGSPRDHTLDRDVVFDINF